MFRRQDVPNIPKSYLQQFDAVGVHLQSGPMRDKALFELLRIMLEVMLALLAKK